ncbi:hypothetical protein BGW36DRAFT_347873 [Talaromyces proteolyticus]|uniref:Uncharacterized protein n=1 Tax=Talaromyces proteolyticus TaxID=1131652 RepID=A0AAD4KIJ1_9EURO|nr:uncharacterized protein BGW36DRAFT_347873 [Talaromyces proteolyticus]KAH8691914.1 hypothetical protein BGW36DRAFT_347873 [Talaromyces proteolyticus]
MSSFHLQNRGTVSRPGGEPTIQTRYTNMLLEVDRIPLTHTVLAAFFQWLLLAGYLVVPGTFTSLESSTTLKNSSSVVIRTIQNPPLIAISCIFLFIGASGMSWLAWIRRNNYIWLAKLFRPTLSSAVIGLLTTLINVYTARHGDWSIMAILTVSVTSSAAATSLALIGYFQFFRLATVKKEHERFMLEAARQRWRRQLDM